ncbi:MAG: RnfABCDGE type electron transport complex subunit D [Firmicutes bacterium]|nr:RnfABCDGE type electron transport complex subunit D [Bacillota bacterium]
MTNRKSLTVSPSPHIFARTDTATLMRSVVLALMPAQLWAIYIFGLRALLVTAVSVTSCVSLEWIYRRMVGRSATIGDWSAAVTGMILAMGLPANIPYRYVILAAFCAIIIAKQLFGGLGQNFVNPALLGRTVLFFGASEYMNRFPLTLKMSDVLITAGGGKAVFSAVDTVTGPTPLALFSNARMVPSNLEMFLGRISGSMGEICTLALLLGGIYLCVRKVISPIIPAAYILSAMATALLRGFDPVFHVCAGGLVLAAFFMATDPATSPITRSGKLIYGILLGVLTISLRLFTIFPDGVTPALLLMNILTPFLERVTVNWRQRSWFNGKEEC